MITITIYSKVAKELTEEFYQQIRGESDWMPKEAKDFQFNAKNARWYWSPETIEQIKNQMFDLEDIATYCLEDEKDADKLFRKLIHKANGIQKTVPGAVAIQVERSSEDGTVKTLRFQWGQIAKSTAQRWCKVEQFSGVATEAEDIEILAA